MNFDPSRMLAKVLFSFSPNTQIHALNSHKPCTHTLRLLRQCCTLFSTITLALMYHRKPTTTALTYRKKPSPCHWLTTENHHPGRLTTENPTLWHWLITKNHHPGTDLSHKTHHHGTDLSQKTHRRGTDLPKKTHHAGTDLPEKTHHPSQAHINSSHPQDCAC